jgi:hypothetical protein
MSAGGQRVIAIGKIVSGALIGAAALAASLVLMPRPAAANPTFARMTGHTCAVCHVPAQEPRLNPTGEEFKSCGFSFCKGPPAATARPEPAPAPVQPPPHRVEMCDTFSCNYHDRCVFRIVSRNGATRNITVYKGESYKVRDIKVDDQYCTVEADYTCNMKAVNARPCN